MSASIKAAFAYYDQNQNLDWFSPQLPEPLLTRDESIRSVK